MNTKISEYELLQPGALDFPENYDYWRILVRAGGKPLGWCSFSKNAAENIEQQLQQQLKSWYGSNLLKETLRPPSPLAPEQLRMEGISVVVCTRNRSAQLATCLQSLLSLQYPFFEIIVVDNAPSDDATAQLVAHLPVRYVREDRPGLNWARNRGIAAAQHGIVAFTDDDVRVDARWLQSLAATFSSPEVMCATGYVAPAQLETPAQHVFELAYGGMGHGLDKKVFHKSTLSEQQLLWAPAMGVGANMGFRKIVFDAIGVFDTALDVGTPSHGGGDVEMFYRLVNAGFLLVYDPAAIVWHYHRPTNKALRRQIFDNGRSFGCYLLHCTKTRSRLTVLRFFLLDWLLKWNIKNLLRRHPPFARKLSIMELYGMLTSVVAYSKTLRNDRKLRRSWHVMEQQHAKS